MPEDVKWMQVTEHWRSLLPEERWRRHLEVIPRHVANSMAMEGKPVDEAWIRERLARHLAARSPSPSQPPQASEPGCSGVLEATGRRLNAGLGPDSTISPASHSRARSFFCAGGSSAE